MRSSFYNALRLCAGLITILVVVAHDELPQKRLTLYPNPEVEHVIFGTANEAGGIATSWLNEQEETWRCLFEAKDNFFCGYSLYYPAAFKDFSLGMDLSGYTGINVRLRYEGPAQRIRLFLRNYNPSHAKNGVWDSTKFMAVVTRTSDFGDEAHISLSEFSVADWWILDWDIDRKNAAPEFGSVVAFGIDFITPGEHVVKVEKVEMVGPWIATEPLYLGVITLWMILIVWEGATRVYILYRRSTKNDQVISNLVKSYSRLEMEKKEYEALSTTDVLTGVMNRMGINIFVEKLFGSDFSKEHIGMMMFDIDHFKRINDELGHDAGDRILKGVAAVVTQNIRQTDVFGRWGGEEFMMVCPQTTAQDLKILADKLRRLISEQRFEDNSLQVTVSIGATTVHSNENFEAIFKRADEALYEAKKSGRNRVIFRSAPGER